MSQLLVALNRIEDVRLASHLNKRRGPLDLLRRVIQFAGIFCFQEEAVALLLGRHPRHICPSSVIQDDDIPDRLLSAGVSDLGFDRLSAPSLK